MKAVNEDNFLEHYGIKRRSGRYPWGSGGTELSRSRSFMQTVAFQREQGLTDTQIARGHGMTTGEFRALKTIAVNKIKQADISMAQRLSDKGMSNSEVGRRMGKNESVIRAYLAPGAADKAQYLNTISSLLKDRVDEHSYIDVGKGVPSRMGISAQKLDSALAILKHEGYEVHTIAIDQLGGGAGQKTKQKVLTLPGNTYANVAANQAKIRLLDDWSGDGGRSILGITPPMNLDSSRLGVVWKEHGGAEKDGVIFVRPGKADLSMDGSHYAQVRIQVDGTHYIKGMAVYSEKMPKGVDVLFHTNKSQKAATSKLDALKPLERKKVDGKDVGIDTEDPFGTYVRQVKVRDAHGKETAKLASVMNLVNEEGTWDTWSRTLSSQFLSKQSPTLVKSQLDVTGQNKKLQLAEIMELTNPTVRKKLLLAYADGADASSVHLKAAQMPRQSTKVIMPLSTLKENEVYAPSYKNGERVVLVRHPHGGVFELPELVVNNRNQEGRRLLGPQSEDAIGIHHKTAQQLSGADFDGDTVVVISNRDRRVTTSKPMQELINFDPRTSYPGYPGMKRMTPKQTQMEMGKISNLITDMTIKAAPPEDIARAVRHSMVVIDAEKHNLNYTESARANGILKLKEDYQGDSRAGASTIISRAGTKSTIRVPEFKERSSKKGGPIDKATGKKVYEETGASYVDKKTGKTVHRMTEVPRLAYAKDAHTLTSRPRPTEIEKMYADHSNLMKALANQARKEAVNTKPTPTSTASKAAYHKEVASLDVKLTEAYKNAPLERQAQIFARANVSARKAANPDMDKDEEKKITYAALTEARARTGASKTQIKISEREWHAIQAGAVSTHKLEEILNNSDLDHVKKLATPRSSILMTNIKVSRARLMAAQGFTQKEIADQLGVSLTTLKTGLKS